MQKIKKFNNFLEQAEEKYLNLIRKNQLIKKELNNSSNNWKMNKIENFIKSIIKKL